MPLLDNRIAWDIARDVPKTSIRQGESSKVNIWRPEDIEEVLNAVKDYDCPYGGKIGNLLDTTPPEQMYMYMSEERCWETWFGGRTVLLGDGKNVWCEITWQECDIYRVIFPSLTGILSLLHSIHQHVIRYTPVCYVQSMTTGRS